MQLFLLNPGSGDITGLDTFYSSVLQAWQIFAFKQPMSDIQSLWVYKELLCFNSFLSTQMLQSANLRTSLCVAGCTNLDHLLKTRDSSLHLLRKRIN